VFLDTGPLTLPGRGLSSSQTSPHNVAHSEMKHILLIEIRGFFNARPYWNTTPQILAGVTF